MNFFFDSTNHLLICFGTCPVFRTHDHNRNSTVMEQLQDTENQYIQSVQQNTLSLGFPSDILPTTEEIRSVVEGM